MCASKETDVRESPNVSTLAGGERQGSRGETAYNKCAYNKNVNKYGSIYMPNSILYDVLCIA
jgi:hypothetical protein